MRALYLLLLLATPLWSHAQRVWLAVDSMGVVRTPPVIEDHPEAAVRALAHHLGGAGWLLATPLRQAAQADTVRVVFALGPRVSVREIEVQGDATGHLSSGMAALRGEPYSASALEARMLDHLATLRERGFGSARIDVVSFDVRPDTTLHLVLRLEQGPRFVQGRLRAEQAGRTTEATLQRLTGWRAGALWRDGQEAEIRSRLVRSGLFQRVGTPALEYAADGEVHLVVPLDERSPGAFDLVVGLQPRSDGTAQWVGSGFIQLQNALGTGERASFRFERLPGTVSRVEATADWPRVPVLPVGLLARFTGVQQDSLFARQSAGLETFITFDVLSLGITLTSERIRPGLAGARLGADGQRVARSDALFRGIRARWGTQVDEGLDVYVAQGRRSRVRQRASSEWEQSRETQYRLEGKATVRAELPSRWDLRAGMQGWMLRTARPEASELYRIGGAATFRGYEEDQFLASHAVRGFVEPGFRLDADARAFVFAEAGRVREPLAARQVRPTWAYGAGASMALGTGGLVVTYALTPDAPFREGKIHLVLSLGF